MELSSEDSLRLHVLLKNVQAVRIDEQAMTVYGLSPKGDAKVPLRPNCRADQYLRRVREFFSGVILGSPGGYPVHLMRWTRMGQTKDTNLAELLMLGESEAVTAVACAPGLTDDLARRVWWIEPTSENARRMLAREEVVKGTMGKVLADHLIEHLPFETDARVMLETVRLVLQPGLIDAHMRAKLWERGARQSAYRVGFLETVPHELPQPVPARADLASHRPALQPLADAGNRFATLLLDVLDSPGQTYVRNTETLVQNLGDPDVAAALLNAIGAYFSGASVVEGFSREVHAIVQGARSLCTQAQDRELRAILDAAPSLQPEIAALVTLAQVSEAIVTDILAHTSATGSLLKRKLAPVTEVVARQFAALGGARHG